MPAVGAEVLLYFYGIPAEQRQPVLAEKRHLHCRPDALFRSGLSGNSGAWRSRIVQLGVWVSLSKNAFDEFLACFHATKRSHIGPFFGWLSAELPLYPSMENLKTRVHLRDDGIRPYVGLEPTDHPLAVEQRNGISVDRVAEIYACYEHRPI